MALLADLAAADLTVARVVEAHLDAVAILAEAAQDADCQQGVDPGGAGPEGAGPGGAATWGVFAAEAPGAALEAEPDGQGGWLRSTGSSPGAPWPAGSLTPWSPHGSAGARPLFAISRGSGVRVDARMPGRPAGWWTCRRARSPGASARDSRGRTGWYLTRPGFSWGGAGVAAIWYGAAVGLARTLRAAAERRDPDQIAHLHLGAVDTALAAARAVLVEAALVADDPETPSGEAVLVAQRARQVVADAAEEILTRLGHALGPAPLTGDEDHARRVADLTVYLRQHHAERDLAALGPWHAIS